MHAKISAEMLHPETGAHLGGVNKIVEATRDNILEAISDLISGRLDHYTDTPAERRGVITLRIEYL